ncbi:MAG: hypothetical protein HY245_08495 [Rhizobiales bacterium]|nr:hypothetical protein [Hyphomicrobiales bacterium]
MKAKYTAVLKFALLSFVALAAPVGAAEPATQVNVALLDMSSLMGPGLGAAMMGGGWGVWGMMGNGQGMMGMGAMTVRADHAMVKAGPMHFSVSNWSRAVVHEMLVVAVSMWTALTVTQ